MGFQSDKDYFNFSLQVTHAFRYALNDECRSFLQNISDTVSTRTANLSTGTVFWRAQIGYELKDDPNDVEGLTFDICPHYCPVDFKGGSIG